MNRYRREVLTEHRVEVAQRRDGPGRLVPVHE
jgi:hypothetical protein